MFELLGKTNIDFIGKRRYAYLFSGVLATLGLVTIIQIARGQANTGIDFAGGTAVQLAFQQAVHLDEARALLEREGFPDAELQQFTEGNKLLVRVKKQTTIQEKTADRLVTVFRSGLASNPFVIDSSTEIGPTVGAKLQRDAVKAIVIAMIGIVLYIALRFELRFGVAAAVATFHDVLAVLGILWLLDKEINLLTVTALLTLAGYSLTDTVVVFDRIRENLRVRRRDGLEQVINQGINQVLSRTIVVSLTVFLVLLALFFFGGEVIHDFSLALLLGVVIGTYSSIFVASPLLLVWPGAKGKLLTRAA
jgi:preprotein translocase subunit SecF